MDSALSVNALDAWAHRALAEVGALPEVQRAGLAVVEGGGRQLLFTSTERVADGSPDWCHIDAYDDVPLTLAVRQRTIVAGLLEGLDPRFAGFARAKRASGSRAIAAIPLTSGETVVGGCILYFDSPQLFDEGQRTLLRELGTKLGERLAHSRRSGRRRRRKAAAAHSSGAQLATHEVGAADLSGVPAARSFLRRTLEGWRVEEDTIDNALVCLSEMVTNALIHADGGCQVEVELDGGVLAVRVHDEGAAALIGESDRDDRMQIRGRGLQIVEALTARSGRDEQRAVSWFELDV